MVAIGVIIPEFSPFDLISSVFYLESYKSSNFTSTRTYIYIYIYMIYAWMIKSKGEALW